MRASPKLVARGSRWTALLLLLGSCAHAAPSTPGARLPQASAFQSETLPSALQGDAVDDALRTRFEVAVTSTHLRPDGRLAALALALADDSDAASRPPSFPVVTYHARRVGMAEPTPQVWLASGPSTESLAASLERAVTDASRNHRLTHAGVGARLVPGGVVVVLAMSTRVFTLNAAVPRSVPKGSEVRLDVTLADGFRQPTLAVTDPDGSVTRESLGPDAHFIYTLRPTRVGEYTVELLASGPEGLTVVAIVPVMVGRELVEAAPPQERDVVERDAEAVTKNLLASIEAERKQRNLPPLRVDVRLTEIALAHSQDMVEHDFIAHTSKRTGDATARIANAGLKARLVLENIGRGYSAGELHRGLMASPGHRGNILHPDARELGIGVVAEREGDRYAFIATELFTQLEPR